MLKKHVCAECLNVIADPCIIQKQSPAPSLHPVYVPSSLLPQRFHSTDRDLTLLNRHVWFWHGSGPFGVAAAR